MNNDIGYWVYYYTSLSIEKLIKDELNDDDLAFHGAILTVIA